MKRLLMGGIACACVLAGPMLSLVVVAVAVAVAGTGAAGWYPGSGAAAGSLGGVPPAMLRLYPRAAATCPGLPWQVLAAVAAVESDSGMSGLPGVHHGHNAAGAEGPMQFEPATFAAFARPVPPGGADPPSPYDPVDAVYAAARMLCAAGAAGPEGLGAALFAYNHSAAYVARVLAVARGFGLVPHRAGAAATRALDYALAQVGTPYRWGGETPGIGFDCSCSGLAQAAYAAAGVALPRVAEDQMKAGPAVPAPMTLAAGDLVFFGPGPGQATHVGLVVDPSGVMVDAPHSGATVRVESFPTVVGQPWGGDVYLGATAPG